YAGIGQRLGEGIVVVADNVEINNEAWAFVVALTKKLADALSHWRYSPRLTEPSSSECCGQRRQASARDGDAPTLHTSSPAQLPWIGWGNPRPHGRQR